MGKSKKRKKSSKSANKTKKVTNKALKQKEEMNENIDNAVKEQKALVKEKIESKTPVKLEEPKEEVSADIEEKKAIDSEKKEKAEKENIENTPKEKTDIICTESSKEKYKNDKHRSYWNLVKVLFSLCITVVASIISSEPRYFVMGTLEIVLIFAFTDLIHKKNRIAANIFNSILNFMYNLEVVILIFGSTFLSRVMLTNLTSIEDLEGRAVLYIAAAIVVVSMSCLKYKENTHDVRISKVIIVGGIFIQTILFMHFDIACSPLWGYYTLAEDEVAYYTLMKDIKNNNADKHEFYNAGIEDVITADNFSANKPNVILIFTEGLSQNIVLDERNIMPNVKAYEEKSINFTGYYNHTFATYRGIIGQLFSGYQNKNLDENHLISIQSIMKDNGYVTCFVNTEPKNKEFTRYAKKLGFDEVVSGKKTSGAARTMSDKQAYEELFAQAKRLTGINKPFFITMYTFGTHVSLDTKNEEFGDGTNNVLNRFYNVDFQFGKFMEEFEKSELFDNTIIVFTTDHCSYSDLDYISTFDDVHERTYTMLDDMPLFIYHKNIKHEDIEVDGRNSLCLAPTILDYLDISAPNYFLGSSLFSGVESKTEFEYAYQSEINYCTTKNKVLSTVNEDFDEGLKEKILDYYAVCSQ